MKLNRNIRTRILINLIDYVTDSHSCDSATVVYNVLGGTVLTAPPF
jgi:hypothetical protein